MGNSNPQNHESRTVFIVNHPKFRQHQIHQNISQLDAQLMRTCLSIEHDSIYTEWQQNVSRLAIDDQNFLLPKSYQFIRNTICGSSGILKVDYDNYPYLLSDQIENRAPSKKHFEEEEIWYLLFVTVSNAQQFYHYQKKLGDIRPSNMFINDTGQLKTTCLYTFPGQKTNYQKTLLYDQLTYLSPEEAAQIKLLRAEPASNPGISESFSIGLSILQSGILQNMLNLYNGLQLTKKKDKSLRDLQQMSSFDFQLLQKYLNQWMNLSFYSSQKNSEVKYCDSLKYAILGMCSPNPENRYSSKQVYEWLRPHEVDIVNLHPFSIGMLDFKKENSGGKLITNASGAKKQVQFKQSQRQQGMSTATQARINSHIEQRKKQIRPSSVRDSSPILLNSSRRKSSAFSRDDKHFQHKGQNFAQDMFVNRQIFKPYAHSFDKHASIQIKTQQNSMNPHYNYNPKYPPAKFIRQVIPLNPNIVTFNGISVSSLTKTNRQFQQRQIGSNISSIQHSNRQPAIVSTQNVKSFMGSLNDSPLNNIHFMRTVHQHKDPITADFRYTSKQRNGNEEQKQSNSGKNMNRGNLNRLRNVHTTFSHQQGQPISFEYYLSQNRTQVSGFENRKDSKSPQHKQRSIGDMLKRIDDQLQKSKLQFPSIKKTQNSSERLKEFTQGKDSVNEYQEYAK